MAHRREEAAFRDVGVLGRGAGRLELRRAQPVLGDVARDGDHRAVHAVRPGARLDPVRPHLDPDHPHARPATGPPRRSRRTLPDMDAELHGDGARARGGVADRLEEGRPIRHVDPCEQAATLERAGRHADQLGGGGVRLQDVAAVIVPRDEVVDRLQERAVVSVAPARRRPAGRVEAGGRHRVDRAAGERRDRDGPDRDRAGPGRAREEPGVLERCDGENAEGSQDTRRGCAPPRTGDNGFERNREQRHERRGREAARGGRDADDQPGEGRRGHRLRGRERARAAEDEGGADRKDEAGHRHRLGRRRHAAPEKVRHEAGERDGAFREARRDEAGVPRPFERVRARGLMDEPGQPLPDR